MELKQCPLRNKRRLVSRKAGKPLYRLLRDQRVETAPDYATGINSDAIEDLKPDFKRLFADKARRAFFGKRAHTLCVILAGIGSINHRLRVGRQALLWMLQKPVDRQFGGLQR